MSRTASSWLSPSCVAQRAIERGDAVALRLRQRTAVSPLGERLEGLDVARLRREPALLDPADARGDDLEMVLDRLQGGLARSVLAGLIQVDLGQPLDHGLGRRVLVFGPRKIELGRRA